MAKRERPGPGRQYGTSPTPPSSGGERVTIQERVEELLAKMTPVEKAGQLTQYFYFRLPEGAPGPVLDFDPLLNRHPFSS